MVKAQNNISSPTSRRNFLRSGSAVIAALAIPALPAPSVEAAVPSLEDNMESLITQFEGYGYSITATVRDGKCVGIYTLLPDPAPKIDYDEFMSMFDGYRDLKFNHHDEFASFLVNSGRLS